MMPPTGLYARAMRLSMTLALTLACAALALFWPGWLTSLRAQIYGYPVSISIVGSAIHCARVRPKKTDTCPALLVHCW